jgi:hypothetical protein
MPQTATTACVVAFRMLTSLDWNAVPHLVIRNPTAIPVRRSHLMAGFPPESDFLGKEVSVNTSSGKTLVFSLLGALVAGTLNAQTRGSILDADLGLGIAERVVNRMSIAQRPALRTGQRLGAMTPAERRAAVDAVWGPGFSPAIGLEIFDRFWNYVDAKFPAFQGVTEDWRGLRDRYRPEVAAGVSRGRLAAIVNRMSLALRDGHTIPLDLFVNAFTVPEPGVPLFGVGAWMWDTSGACLTAQDDGSALVYDVVPGHPMGLRRGDRILGYDGIPWPVLYQQLIEEELPMWPLWWGSGPEGFEHTFVMSAGLNWHLFDAMDVFKHATGTIEHVPTSRMPGVMFSNFCSEQMGVAGVSKPTFSGAGDSLVRWGVVDATNVGYIYVWGWFGRAPDDFAAAVHELTEVRGVDALVLDFRFNVGGFLRGPLTGLAALFEHPSATIGMDERLRPTDHLEMKSFGPPSEFKVDFDRTGVRNRASFNGRIAVLVGPGALSAGDYGAIWAGFHPNVRTFGKSTAMATGLPTQPALGTALDLHPEWAATIAETNTYRVGAPRDYLIHTDLVVDERVWLRPQDVAVGKDTVVEAALRWLIEEGPDGQR